MVILGLGSNMGDRLSYLRAAVRMLVPVLHTMRLSQVYESAALLLPEATPDINLPFLNMAVIGDTPLSPDALLATVKNMERDLGRIERSKWGPREIDIDILAMDGQTIDNKNLVIPHPELLNRAFAMLPLHDIAPDWHYPVEGAYYNKTPGEIIAMKAYALNPNLQLTAWKVHV